MRSTLVSRTLATATAVTLLSAGFALSLGDAPAPESTRGSAWLGVWLEDAVDGGVEIVAVVPGGPAARSRLRPGDIILRANSSEIPVQAALRAVLVQLEPGDPLDLQVLRAGRELDTRVTLVARAPEPESPPRVKPRTPVAPQPPRPVWRRSTGGLRHVGLRVADVSPALRTFYGAPEDAGVLVTRAEPEKPAGQSGIRVGDILVRLGESKLSSEDQLESTLERWNPRQPLSAVVVRDGKSQTVILVSGANAAAEVNPSERRKLEREILTARLQRELARLELRIAEIREELEALRDER